MTAVKMMMKLTTTRQLKKIKKNDKEEKNELKKAISFANNMLVEQVNETKAGTTARKQT